MDKFRRHYILKFILLPLIILALLIWVYTRWGVWFGNPPESPYVVPNEIRRVLLTMGDDANSRYASWQDSCFTEDDEQSAEFLDYYCLSDSSNMKSIKSIPTRYRSRAGEGFYYHALMDSLQKGETYTYRIRSSKDTTLWYQFEMDSATNYSFLYFGDVQDELEGGFDTLLPSIMKHNPKVSFLLFGGDLIERPMDCYWNVVFRSLDTFATRYPILSVPGNHEYLKGLTRTLERRYTLTFPYFNVDEESDNAIYTFSRGDARFFLLDSNKDIWKYASQRSWLKEQLNKSAEKWKIVVLHHPIHSIKGATNNLGVRAFFDGVIKDAGVDLILQGHEHGYARSAVDTTEKGLVASPLSVVSYCSQKDYALNFYGDVEKWGTDDRYYQQISIENDSLILKTFGAEHNLYDEVVIVKKNGERHLIDRGKTIPQKIQVSEWFKKTKSRKKVEKFERSIEEWKNGESQLGL